MMIVLVDDDDDGDGVDYSHIIIINHHLGLLSLSMSCNHIQTTKVEHVVVVVQYQSLLWGT